MNLSKHNLEKLLDRVIAGRLDDLSPAEVAALEQALHAEPALAERLARAMPPVDSAMQVPVAKPTVAEWSRVWGGIERGEAASSSGANLRAMRVFSLWKAATAAAACVALFAIWRALPVSRGDGGEVRLASSGNVEILDMAVFGGRSATLHFADDGSGAVIISISDPEDDDSGAS